MIFDPILARERLSAPKLPRGTRFLAGGLLAAVLVVGLAGGSFMLSAAGRGTESGEGGVFRLPRPALSLAAASPGFRQG